jgi:hypothetical protein
MRSIRLQFFFFLISFSIPATALPASQIYALTFTDVDRHNLSTADGRVTVIVLTKSTDTDKARLVADRVPDFCVGSPTHRFITIITFEQRRSAPTRMLLSLLARHRLDVEAQRLQPRYTAKKLARNARADVFAVLDFDGAIAAKLGVVGVPPPFQVLVLGPEGQLLHRWSDVPSAAELAAGLQ